MLLRLIARTAMLAVVLASFPVVSPAADMPSCKAGDPVVWVNTSSHVYHLQGDPYYGKTKAGAYECESAAVAAGARASGSGKKASSSSTTPSAMASGAPVAAPDASPTPKAKKKHKKPVASPTP